MTGDRDVAVIGMACRLPGGVRSPEDLWRLLLQDGDAITEVPASRWSVDRLYSPERAASGTIASRWMGIVEDVDQFDAAFFGLSPAEADSLDPQQRLLLELTQEALERAGLPAATAPARRCGVFVGISGSDYGRLRGTDLAAVGPYHATGQALSIAANRISYTFDFRGPSVAIDTACSSGLVAVDLAVRGLRTGSCEVAVVGAVNLALAADVWVALSKFGMLARDGRCRSFGAGGDGYVRAEGCGVVVLKPLSAAQQDGDEILAVIRGTAVNQDGRSNGLTAPTGPAQEAVIRAALADGGVPASAVGYVEAHGSGTPLGDPIEMGALIRTYGERADGDGTCFVGSVKSNIGHAEAAAGIAGLLKLVLCLRHRWLPASLHASPPNPGLQLNGTPLRVVTAGQPWMGADLLVGAVSSFGFGGTNAHLVLSEAPARPDAPEAVAPTRTPMVLPLSARDPAALHDLAGRWADVVRNRPEVPLRDFCHTAAARRDHHRVRDAVLVRDRSQAAADLDAVTGAGASAGAPWRDPVFVFSGQGREYPGLAAALLDEAPFAAVVDRCEAVMAPVLGLSVRLLLAEESAEPEPLSRTDVAQAVLFTLQAGLVEVWAALGIRPAAVVGYSAGEVAAAYAAGMLELEAAARLVLARGSAMAPLHGNGRMLVVHGAVEHVEACLGGSGGAVVAAVNGPAQVVLSGTAAAVADAAGTLRSAGLQTVELTGRYAFHSPLMDPAATTLRASGMDTRCTTGTVPFASTVTGKLVNGQQLDSAYWAAGITGPVRFIDAVESLAGLGLSAYLEFGPRPTHAAAIVATARHLGATSRVVPAYGGRSAGLAGSLAMLYEAGADIDWQAAGPNGRFVADLPTYPWQRRRFWSLPEPVAGQSRGAAVADTIADVIRTTLAEHLQLPSADVDENASFLDLGADSLVLVKLAAAVNEAYGTDLEAGALFDQHPTVTALATAVRASSPTPKPPAGAPLASADPAGSATEPATVLERIAAAQLEVMRDQLRVLSTAGPGSAPTAPPVLTAPAAGAPARAASAPPVPGATRATGQPVATPSTPAAAAGRLTGAQKRYVDDLVARMSARGAVSKELAGRFRARLAESRPWGNYRAVLKELLFPIVAERAKGTRIWDVDGNRFTDYCLGFGVHLFGHGPDFVTAAVRRQLDRSYSIGFQTAETYRLAEEFCALTGNDRVTFCNTGSEAVMGALRLARLATGRRRIAYFDKSYHGLVDSVLARSGAGPEDPRPVADGLSAGAVGEAIVLPYGERSALDQLRAMAPTIAAVVVEPVQNRNPSVQPAAFLTELRELTASHGIVLVFDEMITGFRVGVRGAQGRYDIAPDLSTYGKVLGGGLPIAAIAGRAELMAGMDGGVWSYGDDSAPRARTTLFGGTFQKHPLAVAAARAVLAHLRDQGEDLYRDLDARAARATRGLSGLFQREALPYSVASFGSLWRLEYGGVANFHQPLELEMLYHSLLADGIYVWEGRTFFLSTAHDDRDIEELLTTVDRTIGVLREADSPPATAVERYQPTNPQQVTLCRLQHARGKDWNAYHEHVLLHLAGPLDRAALRSALGSVWRRHPLLRGRVVEDGHAMLLASRPNLPLTEVDLAADDPEAYRRAIEDWTGRDFDLGKGPLFRALLLGRGAQLHTLALAAHHVVLDGTALAVLLADLGTAYAAALRGETPPLSERPLPRPTRPAPPPPTGVASAPRRCREPAARRVQWQPGLGEALAASARELGCTPFVCAAAAFGYALHEVTERTELTLGFQVDRRSTAEELDVVGHFADLVAVRSQSEPGESFDSYRARMQIPLAALLSAEPTDPADEPDAVFDLNPPLVELGWPGLTVELAAPPPGHAKFDLFFDVIPRQDGHLVNAIYRPAYGDAVVDLLFQRWNALLTGIPARHRSPDSRIRRSEPAARMASDRPGPPATASP